eukprot:Protomagalhaensia_wolfi_Nauph_80__837@NODE_1484_length_1506_cov_2285_987730_g1150_i0_p1_GENE_NODE_1484_length_1506_cov_2285_987730_g1150_i0NODE_1484_length_1506_cov_2285_987730_g1150_i0_p1_ORF_typecomplete_len274_score52_32TIP120/PF08623_10/0_12_NODE_1484_length_1506_cov_2285_987730_g1150_i06041425
MIHAGVLLAEGMYPPEAMRNKAVLLEILKHKCMNETLDSEPDFLRYACENLNLEVTCVEEVPAVALSLKILISILNEAPIKSINLLLGMIPSFIDKMFALVKSSEKYIKKVELGTGVEHIVDSTIETRRLALIVMSHMVTLLGTNGLRRAVAEKTSSILSDQDTHRVIGIICDAVYYGKGIRGCTEESLRVSGIGDDDDIMNLNGVAIVQRILDNEKDFWKILEGKAADLLKMLGICDRYFKKQGLNQEDLINTRINSRLESIAGLTATLAAL